MSKSGKAAAAEGAGIGASMLIAGWQSASNSINEARLIKAQNAARIKRMREQFSFDTQNMYNNEQSINQQKFRNDVLIQENKLEAEDRFAQAFAGSGISGRSVDALEASISDDVAKAQTENQRQAQGQKDAQFLGLMRSSQMQRQSIEDMVSFDVGAAQSNMDMAMLSAGIQSGMDMLKGSMG